MVDGAAPVVIDNLNDPDYADLEHAGLVRAYAGVPLTDDTGEMFGVLCGFGPTPLEDVGQIDGELINLMGDLLSSHLVTARCADRERRAVQIARALAQTDALTGLTNRRGWDSLVADAFAEADRAMYANKPQHRSSRS
jgi:GAF domain-containing protein